MYVIETEMSDAVSQEVEWMKCRKALKGDLFPPVRSWLVRPSQERGLETEETCVFLNEYRLARYSRGEFASGHAVDPESGFT